MNYMGRILAEGFSGDFLKECLSLAPKEYPYRGPLVYQNGEYSYHCIVTVSLSGLMATKKYFTMILRCMSVSFMADVSDNKKGGNKFRPFVCPYVFCFPFIFA